MKTNYLEKRTRQERLIIAKTLLETVLDDMPSAEPEIIRCRDCKHWYSDADCGMACELTNMSQPEDGFCNWAERREECTP